MDESCDTNRKTVDMCGVPLIEYTSHTLYLTAKEILKKESISYVLKHLND